VYKLMFCTFIYFISVD